MTLPTRRERKARTARRRATLACQVRATRRGLIGAAWETAVQNCTARRRGGRHARWA